MKNLLGYIIFLILFSGCSEDPASHDNFEPLDVEIRMEVQVLDSTYQIYSRPFSQIYFTTYKIDRNDNIVQLEQSDTTACRNGWGVKVLKYTFKDEQELVVLGAACDGYDGDNYREITVDYNEAYRRIDTLRQSSLIKTFAIYYK